MSVFQPRYKDSDGQWHTSPTWHIEFKDHKGARRRIRGFAEKRATEGAAAKIDQLVYCRASGVAPGAELRTWCERLLPRMRAKLVEFDVLDRSHVAAAAPIDDHVKTWEAHLKASGTGDKRREAVAERVRKVIKGCGFKTLADLDVGAIEGWIRSCREREKKPFSTTTANFYAASMRQFATWAYRSALLSVDPLRSLGSQGNSERDRKWRRRALTEAELRALLEKTATRAPIDGVPGPERALIYRLACESGLRRNEIKTLVVADLDVGETSDAWVRVRAANAKNGREDRIPLNEGLAKLLAAYVEERTASAPVFALPAAWRSSEMLREDLAAAEIVVEDEAGYVVDFHALRVTFGTNLARGRVPLQHAQRLMRHSDPALTSCIYTVFSRDDERRSVAALPDLDAPAPKPLRATGTDGAAQLGSPLGSATHPRGESSGRVRTISASNASASVGAEAGSEPLGNRCSIQLSYGDTVAGGG